MRCGLIYGWVWRRVWPSSASTREPFSSAGLACGSRSASVGTCWPRFLLPAFAIAAPLTYAQFSTDFYLPQTLSTLSRIDDLGNPLSRLLFFASQSALFRVAVFAVPALCWLGAGGQTARPPRPAPRALHYRHFFVFRAQPRSDQGQLAPAGLAEPVAGGIRWTAQTLAARRGRRSPGCCNRSPSAWP